MRTLLLLVSLTVLVACGKSGTCISRLDPETGRDAMCMLGSPESACSKLRASEFFPEDKAAGLLRCKSLGFEFGRDTETLFRAVTPNAPAGSPPPTVDGQ